MRLRTIEEIQYIPVRVRHGKVYYFDENGIVTTCAIKDIPEKTRENVLGKYKNELLYVRKAYSFEDYVERYFKKFKLEDERIIEYEPGTEKVTLQLKKAMARLIEGSRYEDLKHYLKESCDYYNNMYKVMAEKNGIYHDKPEGMDRFIIKILKPIILRIPENENPDTFDIIKVQMELITEWDEDKKSYICDNRREIIRRAVEKIKADRGFRQYGVEVNILALTKMMMLDKNTLELIFELKKEIRE